MKRLDEIELLRNLCLLFGPSGCEGAVSEFISEEIKDCCDSLKKDRLGNIIAHIGSGSGKKIMLSAHMDEVGFMVTEVTDEGYLKFDTVGGIDNRVLSGKNVTVETKEGTVEGVIGSKPIHLKKSDEREKVPKTSSLYIDVGLPSKEAVSDLGIDIGSYAAFSSEFYEFGKDGRKIKGKAIDDRLGCAVLILLMRELYRIRDSLPYDLYFCFTVREEIGISGAQVAAQTIMPDMAIVLETTAVADIASTKDSAKVAIQGAGGAISLMDRSTIYDRPMVDALLALAERENIPVQIKKYVSGGNDASHIHKSGIGVRTLALSAPTRYLHSPACVVDKEDYFSMIKLLSALLVCDELTVI